MEQRQRKLIISLSDDEAASHAPITAREAYILNNFVQGSKTIKLDSRASKHIDNFQGSSISNWDKANAADYPQKYPNHKIRSAMSPTYNCHGMTFASRRTCITEDDTIEQILNEDEYNLIPEADTLPGDVIIYWNDGSADHSGIIVEQIEFGHEPLVFDEMHDIGISLRRQSTKLFRVVSKWGIGHEFVHVHTQCPYFESTTDVRFYRIRNWNDQKQVSGNK